VAQAKISGRIPGFSSDFFQRGLTIFGCDSEYGISVGILRKVGSFHKYPVAPRHSTRATNMGVVVVGCTPQRLPRYICSTSALKYHDHITLANRRRRRPPKRCLIKDGNIENRDEIIRFGLLV
jgi:hypothetical protein